MSKQEYTHDAGQMPDIPGLTSRSLRGEADYPLVLEIIHNSRRADRSDQITSLEDLVRAYATAENLDPARDILIASLADTSMGAPVAIGYSRIGWYSSQPDNRLYYQISYLRSEYRGRGLWRALIRQTDARIRDIAASHPIVAHRFFQAWATDTQEEWMAALESEGYQIVRRFNNMLHPLTEILERPVPPGFEIRPVLPEHLRLIWEAQKEMNEGLFENVAEDWTEDKYPAWLEQAASPTDLWQVAWAGDRVAGIVLARVAEAEDSDPTHGHTEHIYVRSPWRGRGVASALIVHALQVLKAHGMHEAELGVDAENESAAFRLYQHLGYRTFSVDTWFRKAMV
jgi:mycothiol synthase